MNSNLDHQSIRIRLYKNTILMHFQSMVKWVAGNEEFYIGVVKSILHKIWVLCLRKKIKPAAIKTLFESLVHDLEQDLNETLQKSRED